LEHTFKHNDYIGGVMKRIRTTNHHILPSFTSESQNTIEYECLVGIFN